VLLTHATVWTCGPAGNLEQADVLVHGGKIAAVGKSLARPAGVTVVDCQGRDVTPGLIDAHNHSAIVGGVNEGSNSCTAEVRIGDVVNSEGIDLYRELAGGLTVANLLHGSANCMGGQSQVIKLRWGADPEGLKFRAAKPAIKFALGENVKQSNWGEKFTTRYPQTRMGVEQFMREKFSEARDYSKSMATKPVAGELPPRRDLQLDALAEILRGDRMIHCHSYRQDEILMLMRVAEDFGFHVGTFQHVLEGYKVADELSKHGAMASCFTDWWAYKFEVYDAIPYDASLMRDRGVVVSVNSDSTELARRMNLEAAKVAKWGDVPREEALHFVTINPARQLGVESHVGTIEKGKDADLVVWSGDPLSTATRADQTYIDGLLYFDRAHDVAARAAQDDERKSLVADARKAKEGEPQSGEPWAPSYLHRNSGCMDGHEGDEP
jgi:imidazolonepropionase-like amidohydrolase